ncbi:MAG TPA: flagellar basal body rod protein FlgB [Phycisphaerae bacterium]|nr:flagellar basal body rod protein FlgB [Phycisphaerae bacterium]
MSLFDVPNSTPVSMLEKTLAFTEARNRMLAENVANILTPGYRTKQLDVSAFQKALQNASDKRAKQGGAFELEPTKEAHVDAGGMLEVTPSEEPPENLLFQDGTNARIERQMAMLAENTMMNQATTSLLQQYYRTVSEAIRGRAQ